jgi:SagB-type dehydrogenase family enzyme
MRAHPRRGTTLKVPEHIETALAYHERTKHHFPDRYARALGYLDWATQPDPFRHYQGAPLQLLEENAITNNVPWSRVRGGALQSAPLDARSVAQLLYDSLAISAWKQSGGSKWALRCNPSSGNLHPTEAYLICGQVEGIGSGVYHYSPYLHALEQRRALQWDGCLAIALSTIVWREAWKYGERAFRYCMHDVGHAIGAVAVAARLLGWSARIVSGIDDTGLAQLLGVEDQTGIEAERPDVLIAIDPRGERGPLHWSRPPSPTGEPAGRPNALSPQHQDWPVLGAVELATRCEDREAHTWVQASSPETVATDPEPDASEIPARLLVRRRRSAVSMDGVTSMPRADFYRALRALVPALTPSLQPLPWQPLVHPVVFIHRVDGLEPGLALLVRSPAAEAELRAAISLADDWIRLPGAPDDLPLFGIAHGDTRALARACMCQQNIAADGAFAIAFLARFEPTLRERGACWYRRLHWEAGLLGQLLYLEAEALELGATGIGCFFDDAIHELLGLASRNFQTLYCFTVGGPLQDARLQTLPPYAHRAAALAAR